MSSTTGRVAGRILLDIERPDAAVVAGLREAGVATVYEAGGRIGLLDGALQSRQPGAAVAGPAVTVSLPPHDNLMIHAAVEACRPGDILVVVPTSPTRDGMVGELLATSLQARGVVGLVIRAGVRDLAALRAMSFPVWSAAVSAAGTTKDQAGSVNVPVDCGAPVKPGDVIVADDDGVVVVDQGIAASVLESAKRRVEMESARRRALAAGELGLDMYDLRPRLVELGVVYEREGT